MSVLDSDYLDSDCWFVSSFTVGSTWPSKSGNSAQNQLKVQNHLNKSGKASNEAPLSGLGVLFGKRPFASTADDGR